MRQESGVGKHTKYGEKHKTPNHTCTHSTLTQNVRDSDISTTKKVDLNIMGESGKRKKGQRRKDQKEGVGTDQQIRSCSSRQPLRVNWQTE